MRAAMRSDWVPMTTWATFPRLTTPEAPSCLSLSSSMRSGSSTKSLRRVMHPLDALDVLLSPERLEHVLRQHVVAVALGRGGPGGRGLALAPALGLAFRLARGFAVGLVARRGAALAFGEDPIRREPRRVLAPARGSQVEALDEEAEDEVVDDEVDEADAEQQYGPGRVVLAEVQDVIYETSREAKPYLYAEQRAHRKRRPREDGVDEVEDGRHEEEGELDGLGYACQERGEGLPERRMPEATFGTLACRIIARHAAGRPNIMIGKKPERK